MKILQVNKFFYIKGGSETYYFSLKRLLEGNGHQVVDFSMKDPHNFASPYQEYFIENIDYNRKQGVWTHLKLAFKIIYSGEARRKIAALLKKEQPEIAHLHIFQHQMSASIVGALKARKAPVVYTAHDLKAVCPNYKMLRQDNVCELCKGRRYYYCFLKKCVKDSYLKSLISTMEMYFHRFFNTYGKIDRIIAPSKFYREKLLEFGFEPEKVIYLPNFLDARKITPNYEHREYFVFLGRLSEEKGVLTLVKAMENVNGSAGTRGGKLLLIGTGPLEAEIRQYITWRGLTDRIQLTGYQSGTELQQLLKGAMFSVIPSEWYENSPYSVLEMMAYGKPVIGANIGGIPELIEDGRTGLVFEKGNSQELAEKITTLIEHPDLILEYGKNARMKLELEYNAEKHYWKLIEIYESILAHRDIKAQWASRHRERGFSRSW
ncbi:MAG TPA: glycosyltransferase family 4 protein [Bacillota bacterium]|nr:glycosyltransferase family 4 protein [Bacillota bacterium]